MQTALELCVFHLWMKATLLYSVLVGSKLLAYACFAFGCFVGQGLNTSYKSQLLPGEIFGQKTFL